MNQLASHSVSEVPKPVLGTDLKALPITPEDAFVLSRVDGRASVRDIVLATGLTADTVQRCLEHLAALGAVRTLHGLPPTGRPSAESSGSNGVAALDSAAALVVPPPGASFLRDIDVSNPAALQEAVTRIAGQTHYELLGLPRDADRAAIKAAYFSLVGRFHLDQYYGEDLQSRKPLLTALFQRLTEAHDTLSRSRRRAAYDEQLPPAEGGLRRATSEGSQSKPPPAEHQTRNPPPMGAAAVSATPTPGRSAASPSARPGARPSAPPTTAPRPSAPPTAPPSARPTAPPSARPTAPPSAPPGVGTRPSVRPTTPSGASATSPRATNAGATFGHPRNSSIPAPLAASGPTVPAATNTPSRNSTTLRPGAYPSPTSNLQHPSLVSGASNRPPASDGPSRFVSLPAGGNAESNGPQVPNSRRRNLERSLRSSGAAAALTSVPAASSTTSEPALPPPGHRGAAHYVASAKRASAEGDALAAVNALRIGLSLAPEDERIQRLLAEAQARAERTHAEHYLERARERERAGQSQDAFRLYLKAARGKANASLFAHAAELGYSMGHNLKETSHAARRAVELDPTNPHLRLLLGRIYAAAGMQASASSEFDKALELAPTDKDLVARVKAARQ